MEKCFTPTVILLTLFLNERVIALGGGGGGWGGYPRSGLGGGGEFYFIFGLI